MTQRIIPPPDHNDTSETFARSSLHGCRREDFASAGHWYGLALALLLLALLLGMCLLVLCSLTSGGADAATPLNAIPQGVCPPGHTAMWVEEQSTVQCFKELQP